MARRHDEIAAAGIEEILVFHSAAADMLPYQGQLPFAAVADPGRKLYGEFGVTASPRAVLHPKAWAAPLNPRVYPIILRGIRAGGSPAPGTGHRPRPARGLPHRARRTASGRQIRPARQRPLVRRRATAAGTHPGGRPPLRIAQRLSLPAPQPGIRLTARPVGCRHRCLTGHRTDVPSRRLAPPLADAPWRPGAGPRPAEASVVGCRDHR